MIGVEATKWIYAGIVCDWTAPTPSSTESLPAGAAAGAIRE
jgi:hypothetical protein